MQVNFNEKSRSGINRGEFIEALMRIAKIKYVDTGHFKRTALSEAFAKLLEEEIIKKWQEHDCHKAERLKLIWTNEINDLLEVNLLSLKTFFNSLIAHKTKWLD